MNNVRNIVEFVGYWSKVCNACRNLKLIISDLFPTIIKGNPINNPTEAFKRIKSGAKLEESFRLHDIRHTGVSLIINNGGSLYDVQATLGHANSKMSERYAHLSNDKLQETSDNLSNAVAYLSI